MMAVYLQSASEENLQICVLNGLWAAKTNKLSNWKAGDILILTVSRALAGYFLITDESYHDETPIWVDDLYPYRIPIEPKKIVHPEHRYSISNSDTREVLFRHHTNGYATILNMNARPVHSEAAEVLLHHLDASPDWASIDPEQVLSTIQEQQELENAAAVEEILHDKLEEVAKPEEATRHTQIQYALAELGSSLRYQIWIPKSDQGRQHLNRKLRDLSMQDFPKLPFANEVIRVVQNIDVIWLRSNHPTHIFEVEHTTSVYSGLLRMSDLATLLPSLNIGMYICSDVERRSKVLAEVNRPTFSRQEPPLSQRCRFIPFDSLVEFIDAERKYLRHFDVSILDELSQSLALTA